MSDHILKLFMISEELYNDELTHPDKEDSTELGKVPQDAKKGSIEPYVFGAYPYSGYY